jgi:hypothetical protein
MIEYSSNLIYICLDQLSEKYAIMDTNKIILPNGKTFSEAQTASLKHMEHLHME